MTELGIVKRNITRADKAAVENSVVLVWPQCTKPWDVLA